MTILRNAKINIKADKGRRKKILGISLNKVTLEYLYF